jgi:hypothetical protein
MATASTAGPSRRATPLSGALELDRGGPAGGGRNHARGLLRAGGWMTPREAAWMLASASDFVSSTKRRPGRFGCRTFSLPPAYLMRRARARVATAQAARTITSGGRVAQISRMRNNVVSPLPRGRDPRPIRPRPDFIPRAKHNKPKRSGVPATAGRRRPARTAREGPATFHHGHRSR